MAGQLDIDGLFRRYYRQMCLYALHYVQDSDVVEDIVQEAFLTIWQKAQNGAVPLHPRAYLATIVRNGCIDFLRMQASHPEEELPVSITAEEEDYLDSAEQEAELWTAIDRLPHGRRQMLLLHKRDGLSHKEIAKRLGVSEGTVRNQISRALKSLRGRSRTIIPLFFI